MNVEGRMNGLVKEEKLPDVLRVLAVDDDPICLEVLEKMLRKCHYEVTTTNQAVMALKMLRENKSNFDIVISDVNMPDMDGFKLLELVGLEMDLPVIMLSAHSDKELVYKGVMHGAVDYLIKPVRMEVLKNIWQHVIRKRNLKSKDQNRSTNQYKTPDGAGEGGGVASHGNSDHNGKVNLKRKDQGEEEEEEHEEDEHENEESGSQKKPRVVWSTELHQKFIEAVNQLGPGNIVPKKILDMMNVDWLTRENVASHLQKFRLYLKKISEGGHQQGNMAATSGVKVSSYLPMSSVECFGDFRRLSGPGRFSSASLSSYSHGSMLGGLNSRAGLTLPGITLSGFFQSGNSQNLSISDNPPGKLPGSFLPANQGAYIYQGNTSSLEPNHLQTKSTVHIEELNCSGGGTGFTWATRFPDAGVSISGSLGNTVSNTSTSPLMTQVNLRECQSMGAFGAQSSLSMPSFKQESFEVGIRGTSNFADHNSSNDTCQGEVQFSEFPSNSLPLNQPFSHSSLLTNNLRDKMPSTNPHFGNGSIGFSSSSAVTAPLDDSRVAVQGQASLVGNVTDINYTSRQRWEELCQDYNSSLSNSFGTLNSLVSGNDLGLLSQTDHRKRFDVPLVGQINTGASSSFQPAELEKSLLDGKLKPNEAYLLEQQTKSHNWFVQNSFESLDNIVNTTIKRQQIDPMLMDGEFGFDVSSLGPCM